LTAKICWFNSLASLVVTLAAITGLLTPQARPRAVLDGRKTYGTFLSSQRRGLDVGGEDDEFTDTSVEGFGGFVGTGC
jgi:hypothetical protein